MSWVIDHSAHKGGTLLTLLMIGNHAHSDGTGAYPSLKTLAGETRMSVRQVARNIEVLIESGELQAAKDAGPRGVTVYALPLVDKMSSRSTPIVEPKVTSATALVDISDGSSGHLRQIQPLIEPSKNRPEPGADFVAEYVDRYRDSHRGESPQRALRARIGKEARRALAEGKSEGTVQRAVQRAARENKSPSALPLLIADEEGGHVRTNSNQESVEAVRRKWDLK